ncbi:lycopene cyclase domain-containing protein [Candidatus Halobonum tyrrellensis]|uniref:Lycopene cyclase domain-containing protein n=1 Tax=Candidatus Halobonum tyrrellensis G22 TaxID=1324957 RepID=V4HMV1_9EURY|nr:lycopene cyclase domain-containing protein [Candidatus Halobonum tyrrellensis]ESP89259.1 lycopene cyclase domain-containing protein [Candidatus Halobonum tyrrellensis G22]
MSEYTVRQFTVASASGLASRPGSAPAAFSPSSPITYLEFHLWFVLPPLALLALAAVARPGRSLRRVPPAPVGLLVALALVYTTPWDNYLIGRGVWEYAEGAVVGVVWRAPIEEYLFVVFQTLVVALWLARVPSPPPTPRGVSRRQRLAGAVAGASVGAVGAALCLGPPSGFYLGAILAWAGPVLALQWAVGWPHLVRHARTVAAGVVVPAAYLCAVDRLAIREGIWVIGDRYSLGVEPFGLPVEEAVFFVVTTLFVVQGLLLWRWVMAQWD